MKPYKALAVSPNGELALINVKNTAVQLINIESQEVIREFNLSYNPDIFTAPNNRNRYLVGKFSHCGNYVLFGTVYFFGIPAPYDTCINIKTGDEIEPAYYYKDIPMLNFREIAYSDDAQFLVSHNDDDSIILTNIITGDLHCTILSNETFSTIKPRYSLSKCYFSPLNQYLVLYFEEQQPESQNIFSFHSKVYPEKVEIIDTRNGEKILSRKYFSPEHLTVKFSPREESILLSFNSGSWELIATESGQTLMQGKNSKPLAFIIEFIVTYADAHLIIENFARPQKMQFPHRKYTATSATISPDEKYLAVELTHEHDITDKIMACYRLADGKLIMSHAAFQTFFASDCNSIFILTRNCDQDYLLQQFQIADGVLIKEKTIVSTGLTSWIKSIASNDIILMSNEKETWTEKLQPRQRQEIVHSLRPST